MRPGPRRRPEIIEAVVAEVDLAAEEVAVAAMVVSVGDVVAIKAALAVEVAVAAAVEEDLAAAAAVIEAAVVGTDKSGEI